MIKFAKHNHDIDQFSADLEEDIRLYSLNRSELPTFLAVKRASKDLLGDRYAEVLKKVWENKDVAKRLTTANDFYFLVTSLALENKKIKKTAYPMSENYFFKNMFYGYNLQSWASTVHKIYESVYKDGIDYPDAVEKYSANIGDSNERNNFLSWLKYYNQGEHLKYNGNSKIAALRKEAIYQSSLNPGDAYASDYIGIDYDLNHDRQVDDAREKGESKINYKNWKKKFNTALRRVDKILKESEDYVDPDKYEEISGILNKLDVQVGKIRLQVSASDMSYRAANQLKKLGFNDGAKVLYKYSQEAAVPTQELAAPTSEEGISAEPNDIQEAVPAQEGQAELDQAEQARKQSEKNDAERGKQVMKEVDPVPGKKEDEYKEILSGDVTISDASNKLEQIAGTLADRRIIRYLAEFDIMLDKVGIASMFPELAEAQSKLIESYSYALTRVTKMLGMLSNNKAIMEMAKEPGAAVPGESNQTEQTQEVEPAEQTQPEELG